MPYKNVAQRNKFSREWRRKHPEVSRRWRRKHPKKNLQSHRDSDVRRRYGISTYKEAQRIRNRSCMICGKKAKKMCLDHKGSAHVFNQTYRGVLCQQCNVRLGWFERLRKIILRYVKRGSQCPQKVRRNSRLWR